MEKPELRILTSSDRDQNACREAMEWLQSNRENSFAEEVFTIAVVENSDYSSKLWAKTWFKNDPIAACSFLPLILVSTSKFRNDFFDLGKAIVLEKQSIPKKVYLCSQLILEKKDSALLEWAHSWLYTNRLSVESASLLTSLIALSPDQEVIQYALDWYELHHSHWYSSALLARMLEFSPSEKVLALATQRINNANPSDYNVLLLIEPLLKAAPSGSRIVENWINENPNHPLSGEILFESLLQSQDSFIGAAANWIEKNQNNVHYGVKGESVNWCRRNSKNEMSSRILRLLC